MVGCMSGRVEKIERTVDTFSSTGNLLLSDEIGDIQASYTGSLIHVAYTSNLDEIQVVDISTLSTVGSAISSLNIR
jgi:hypothetical protein